MARVLRAPVAAASAASAAPAAPLTGAATVARAAPVVPAATAHPWRAALLGAATAMLLGQVTFVFGAAWDIQWHLVVGRDRLFTPPHVLLLAGVALTGLAALATVLGCSIAGRVGGVGGDGRAGSVPTTHVLRLFRAPLGAYVAGLGALLSTVAFPLDDYWHRLYGIDVTLWSPFHVMILTGMALGAVGTTYAFAALAAPATPATLATPAAAVPVGASPDTSAAARRWASSIGVAASLAATAATFLVLLAQALDNEGIVRSARLGGGRALLAFPPLLVAFSLPWLVAAAPAVRLPGGATLAALALTMIRLGLFAFVPWAVRAAAAAEGLPYRPGAPAIVATPAAFPAWLLLSGLMIDGVWWLVRRVRAAAAPTGSAVGPRSLHDTTGWASLWIVGVAAALPLLWLDRPWARTLPLVRAARGVSLEAAFTASLPLAVAAAVVASAVGLCLGASLRHYPHSLPPSPRDGRGGTGP